MKDVRLLLKAKKTKRCIAFGGRKSLKRAKRGGSYTNTRRVV
jgi:hypothetical protein